VPRDARGARRRQSPAARGRRGRAGFRAPDRGRARGARGDRTRPHARAARVQPDRPAAAARGCRDRGAPRRRGRIRAREQRPPGRDRTGRAALVAAPRGVGRRARVRAGGEMMRRAKISGTGMCVPTRLVTNDDLAKLMDTSDEWIRQRSGIATRYYVEPGQKPSELAHVAVQRALEAARLEARDIDMIILATLSAEADF